MDAVYVVFPSCNPDRAIPCVKRWRDMGYSAAVYLDPGLPSVGADLHFWGKYSGFYEAVNVLTRILQHRFAPVKETRLTVVVAGDDMDPDPRKSPAIIAEECYTKYGETWVMQPTGDDLDGVKRICNSPWLSSGWMRRAYKGCFPHPPWYHSFYGDEEIFEVTRRLDLLYQRNDLKQFHHHWSRPDSGVVMTPYQKENSKRYWDADKSIFMDRKARGFPGSELLKEPVAQGGVS